MEKFLSKLASQARLEMAPEIDVADQVMRIIASDRIKIVTTYERPFMWMAGLSTAAAIAIGTLAIYGYYAWNNPLFEMSETIAWVL